MKYFFCIFFSKTAFNGVFCVFFFELMQKKIGAGLKPAPMIIYTTWQKDEIYYFTLFLHYQAHS